MTSIPPSRPQQWGIALAMGLGGAASYGLANMPPAWPQWVHFVIGTVFTGIVAGVFLYQNKPKPPP